MIAFLTLIYIGILFLLVRFKIVPWNTFWKVSPAIWVDLLNVVLFIPMNWGTFRTRRCYTPVCSTSL
jgi:hypothetical protein